VIGQAKRSLKLPRPSWPHGLVGLSTLFGLVALRGETRFAQPLNDSAFHMQMVRWAGGQIHRGRVPFDGWYPWLSLGSSFFHHYQSLPETLTAYAAAATGASDNGTYLWILYLLLATWPISVYAGSRLLGWGRWTAAGSAAVAPLVLSGRGYGFEWGSYVWSGTGLYGQLWAMWLLPLAWGLTWRSVKEGRRFAAAALAVALTIACHFIAGYLALLTIGVWVIVLGAGRVAPRLARAAVVAAGAMLIALWVLVPLIEGRTWTNNSEFFRGTFFDDSYGAGRVLGWLARGQLFDGHHRFPVISLLVAVGLGVCIWRARRDARARGLLGVFVLSLILFCGRHTLGPVLGWLPGSADLQFQRFEMGVDLAGILLAGVGIGAGVHALRRLWAKRLPASYAVVGAAAIALIVLVLAPAVSNRLAYAGKSGHFIERQHAADVRGGRAVHLLLARVKSLGGGRVYAGLRASWGHKYRVGFVPMYAWLADHDVDAVGFAFRTLNSLSTDIEASFDDRNLAEYQMLAIRYLLLPASHPPPVRATLIGRAGANTLYRVDTSGYFQAVDRTDAIAADRTDLAATTLEWRRSHLALRGRYPGIAFAGAAAPAPTLRHVDPLAGPPGEVASDSDDRAGGVFQATVDMRRAGVVLLKESYDPGWEVTVDEKFFRPVMMAPSLVGVEVGKGRHVVRFVYTPYGSYPGLFAIGALALLALMVLPRRASIVRRAARFGGAFGH
jgi:hypothetical protein